MVEKLRAWPLTLLAEKVESARAVRGLLGARLRPVPGVLLRPPGGPEAEQGRRGKLTMLQLMEQVMAETEISEIEETFKQNPGSPTTCSGW